MVGWSSSHRDGGVALFGLASRLFDLAVTLVGVACISVAVLTVSTSGRWDAVLVEATALAVPLVVLVQRSELSLALTSASPNAPVIAFDSMVLVFLGCVFRADVALVAWGAAQLVACLTDELTRAVRLFNLGLMVSSGAAALSVMHLVGPVNGAHLATTTALTGVVAGWLAYLAVFYVTLMVSLRMEAMEGLREVISLRRALAAIGVHVAVDSLGYLAALLLGTFSWWVAGAAVLPAIAILTGCTALSRAAEHQHRLTALFDAAKEMQLIDDYDGIVALLDRRASDVVGTGGAELRDTPPEGLEIGAELRGGQGPLWLVGSGVNRRQVRRSADEQALAALATVGEEAVRRASLTREMNRMARYDAMTGLANRVLFLERAGEVVQLRALEGSVAVMYLDLDGFKSVNDRFGHSAGDALLAEVAARLTGCVREADLVARLGGDEFAILLDCTDHQPDLTQLAQRIIVAVSSPVRVKDVTVSVGTSIGIAGGLPSDTAEDLLRYADLAMYEAKKRGHNNHHIYGYAPPRTVAESSVDVPKVTAPEQHATKARLIG